MNEFHELPVDLERLRLRVAECRRRLLPWRNEIEALARHDGAPYEGKCEVEAALNFLASTDPK